MKGDRRIGWLVVLAGAALALGAQVAAPVGVPLYDGVVVQEPYRYLHPTGDQHGSPTSYTSTVPVAGDVSPAFAAATTESPPQAQLVAQQDAFVLSPGATSLQVSITPVEASAPPASGSIAGNVYRFSVTDQVGTPLALKACDGCVSLSMRAPDGTTDAILKRFVDGAWADLETLPVGVVSMYQTNAKALGDIAVIAAGSSAPAGPGLDPLIPVAVGALLLWLLVFGFVVWRRTRPLPPPGMPARNARGRVLSKQPGKRRPRSGRSD